MSTMDYFFYGVYWLDSAFGILAPILWLGCAQELRMAYRQTCCPCCPGDDAKDGEDTVLLDK